ncbi:hypothetical protein Tco_0904013 [Tanacetum coccineum]
MRTLKSYTTLLVSTIKCVRISTKYNLNSYLDKDHPLRPRYWDLQTCYDSPTVYTQILRYACMLYRQLLNQRIIKEAYGQITVGFELGKDELNHLRDFNFRHSFPTEGKEHYCSQMALKNKCDAKYCDAGPKQDVKYDCKSTSGGLQFLRGKLVSWSSKKQDFIAMSTAKAEYVSLSARCAQVIWMPSTHRLNYGNKYNGLRCTCDPSVPVLLSLQIGPTF